MNNNITLPSLPSMPRTGRKNRPLTHCACGCKGLTRGTWFVGHDGRATGWAVRIEKGIITIDDVPANERAGAQFMLSRREKERRVNVKETA